MLTTWNTPKTNYVSPPKHNWQIVFLWQEQIDNKELTVLALRPQSNSESSRWKELPALPSVPASVVP